MVLDYIFMFHIHFYVSCVFKMKLNLYPENDFLKVFRITLNLKYIKMHIFRVAFILNFLKLMAGKGSGFDICERVNSVTDLP